VLHRSYHTSGSRKQPVTAGDSIFEAMTLHQTFTEIRQDTLLVVISPLFAVYLPLTYSIAQIGQRISIFSFS